MRPQRGVPVGFVQVGPFAQLNAVGVPDVDSVFCIVTAVQREAVIAAEPEYTEDDRVFEQ